MHSRVSSTSFARPATMRWRARANSAARVTGTSAWVLVDSRRSRASIVSSTRSWFTARAVRSIRCHCSGSTQMCLLMDCSVESAIAFCRPEGSSLLLLLHGFRELGSSWRKVMPALADASYYLDAPDLRGYGPHRRLGSLVRRRLGAVPHRQTGARRAGHRRRGLIRPGTRGDRPRHRRRGGRLVLPAATRHLSSVVLMSALFGGPPSRRPVPDGHWSRRAITTVELLVTPRQRRHDGLSARTT